MSDKQKTNIVILAAGKGTRMRSEKPKVLHSIAGLSFLERTVKAACEFNAGRILMVIGHQAEKLEEELDRLRGQPWAKTSEVVSVIQEEQRGTGHATQSAIGSLTSDCKYVIIGVGDAPLLDSTTFEHLYQHGVTS